MTEPLKINWDEIEEKPASAGLKIAGLLSWLIVWPIVMIGVGIVMISIFVGMNDANFAKNPPSGTAIRGYFLVFIVVMVALCYGLSRLHKRSQHAFIRTGRPVILSYMWIGMLLSGILLVNINVGESTAQGANAGINEQTASGIVAPELQHDPTIVGMLQAVGAAKIDAIDERYVDDYSGKLTDQEGEYQAYTNPTTGGFLYGTLTVKRGLSQEQLKTDVAHEYLHHVWFSILDSQTKENLTSHLISMYGDDPWMKARVKNYSDKGILQPTELFSYYCTESSDGYLTTYVLDECNKYINRGALSMTR